MLNKSAIEAAAIMDSNDHLWIFNLILSILVYLLGTYINWQIICVSRETKDKTWKEDIFHSASMIIAMFWMTIIENVSPHVKVLSEYTGGVWFCYLTGFIYCYNTFIGGFHSFMICLMKYVYIVHYDKVRVYGEEKLQKIFFLAYVLHPLVLTIPSVLLHDYEAYTSVIGCFGLTEELKNRYESHGFTKLFLCKLQFEEGDSSILYYLSQGFCSVKIVWLLALSSNLPEALLYFKIFQFMKR